MDARDLNGGGPIDPRADFGGVGNTIAEALVRVLLLNAGILLGPSTEGLRSRPDSTTPNSDVKDDDRDMRDVVDTNESRRWCAVLLVWAGVFPAVPRTPRRRLS